jgi:hypothetical protein
METITRENINAQIVPFMDAYGVKNILLVTNCNKDSTRFDYYLDFDYFHSLIELFQQFVW